jgi:hypothetical protein
MARLERQEGKPGRTRRQLLTAATGGLAVIAAESAARAAPAQAAQGQPVIEGQILGPPPHH